MGLAFHFREETKHLDEQWKKIRRGEKKTPQAHWCLRICFSLPPLIPYNLIMFLFQELVIFTSMQWFVTLG